MEKREERHEVCRKKPLTNFWFSGKAETSVLFKKQASGAFFWRQGSLIPFCEIFGL